jgi:arginyl-tRNA synthetase
MMKLIKDDLAALGIEMDIFFSEKSLYGGGKIEEAIESLKSKKLIYEGILDSPKGKKVEDWEPRRQTLFKSSSHGDDVDRPIKKSDGTWTYFAPDIAYHFDKVERNFDQLIDIFGADHGGYVKRMKAAVSALSDDKVKFDIKLTQLVKLFKRGEPFKMSKRAGTFVTLRDLVDQVGSDVTRFVMLTRKNDAPLDFDFEKVLEQSRDNPVYYVQYASARIHSVLRKAKEAGIYFDEKQVKYETFCEITHEAEIKIAKKLAEWPRLVEISAKTHEPHRIAFYLYELASDFHSLWNKGSENVELRFIQENNHKLTCTKMAMISAVLVVISSGLGILGVEPATQMN